MSGRATRHGITQRVPVELIDDSPFQVRIEYRHIPELAADIKKRGLLQPILLRPKGERYEVVHGHRRIRAVRQNESTHILATIRELDDDAAVWIQLAENIQRDNYTPLEQAHAYRQAVDRYNAKGLSRGKAIRKVHENVNKTTDHVRDYLNLLDLPDDIQGRLHRKEISFTKARELTKLTRTPLSPTTVVHKGGPGIIEAEGQPAPRTEEHFDAIRRIADKAADGSIKSVDTVARAVDFVREGVDVDEAIRIARLERAAKKSQERVDKADSPEEIARRILKAQPSREELEKAEKEVIIKSVAHLLRLRMLACPHCGGDDLVWACNGSPLLEGGEKDEE